MPGQSMPLTGAVAQNSTSCSGLQELCHFLVMFSRYVPLWPCGPTPTIHRRTQEKRDSWRAARRHYSPSCWLSGATSRGARRAVACSCATNCSSASMRTADRSTPASLRWGENLPWSNDLLACPEMACFRALEMLVEIHAPAYLALELAQSWRCPCATSTYDMAWP